MTCTSVNSTCGNTTRHPCIFHSLHTPPRKTLRSSAHPLRSPLLVGSNSLRSRRVKSSSSLAAAEDPDRARLACRKFRNISPFSLCCLARVRWVNTEPFLCNDVSAFLFSSSVISCWLSSMYRLGRYPLHGRREHPPSRGSYECDPFPFDSCNRLPIQIWS
jgi:hypothetical protein